MVKVVVIWKHEMKDGEIKVLDQTFSSMDEADRHIKQLREEAKTLGKYFKLVSKTELNNKQIKVNKAHKGRMMKGKGWHKDSRRHSLARRGINTSGRKRGEFQ